MSHTSRIQCVNCHKDLSVARGEHHYFDRTRAYGYAPFARATDQLSRVGTWVKVIPTQSVKQVTRTDPWLLASDYIEALVRTGKVQLEDRVVCLGCIEAGWHVPDGPVLEWT